MQPNQRENGNQGNQGPFDVNDLRFPPWTRNAIKGGLVGLGVIILLGLLRWGLGIYTDILWFDNLGYLEVFQTILTTRIWLFFVGAGVFILFAVPNTYLVFRLTRDEIPSVITAESYRVLRKILIWISGIAIAIAALAFGSASASRWETILMYANRSSFTDLNGAVLVDPIFNKGLDFYVFTLPLLGFVRGWLLGLPIVILIFTLIAYAVIFSPRERGFSIPPMVKAHVVGIGAFIFLIIAAGHWIGRYELLYSPLGFVFGVGYTDDNARITVRLIMTFIALISSGLMIAGTFVSGYRLIIGAIGLWIGMAILVGGVFPAVVQRFQVEPSEFSKEQIYIENNIEFTRNAYAINIEQDDIRDHSGLETITDDIIEENRATIENIRLWDERPLGEIYNQVEFVQFYYDFQHIGVDRYTFNGQTEQVMLSTRELSSEKLPEEAQNWVNQHLVFTHGHGAVVSPVNKVKSDGKPETYLHNVPAETAEGYEELRVDQPAVYYGLKSLPFVIVNSKERELDFQGADGKSVFTDGYKGAGGVGLSSYLRRLIYSWQFSDINILISGQVDPSQSKIQYRRSLGERFDNISPFLIKDSDPYQVVADGRIFIIQDAYTITSQYPYSTPFMDKFNYIRNSVKVVLDTYNGTIDYYVYDSNDPLIQTYQKMFGTLFKDTDQMPTYLRDHVRYPRDLFTVQTQMLLQYHMEDPRTFFQKDDQWSIPVQNSFGREGTLDPYYILARLPGEDFEEFLLIQPFTPDKRDPLKAWIAVRNDAPHYGEMVMYRFPGGRSILGPNQIEARIDNDASISQQFTLWGQVGSEIIRGDMLVIPVGDSILYAEPIFLKPETLDFPELRRIILADGQTVVMQSSLKDAIRALKGEIPPVALAESRATKYESDQEPEPITATPKESYESPSEGVLITKDQFDSLIEELQEFGVKLDEFDSFLKDLSAVEN